MRNDSLDDLSLKPSRDELVQRQQGRSPRSPSVAKPAAATPRSSAPLWLLVVLLLVVMAAGGGYLWLQIQRLEGDLHRSLAALSQSEVALSSLQQNLETRDQTLTKTGGQMEAEIKELQSEVRKLWDVSNKRNKGLIEEQGKTIAALETRVKNQPAAIEKQIQAATAGVKKDLQSEWQEVKTAHTELQAALEAQKTAVDKQQAELARLKSSLNSPSDLEDRITNVEVGLKAIDAYRRQVNTRLDQLDQQLGQLYNAPGAP